MNDKRPRDLKGWWTELLSKGRKAAESAALQESRLWSAALSAAFCFLNFARP